MKSKSCRPWTRGVFPWERGPNSRFTRFLSWLTRAHVSSPERSGDGVSLFPSALPYPEVFHAEGRSMGLRDKERWSKAFLNAWVAWSNYVVLGCPDCGNGKKEPQVELRCQKDVRAFTDGLLGEVKEFMDEAICTDSVSCEGGRGALAEAFRKLSQQCACYGTEGILPGALESAASAAIPVVAERVAVPEVAGSVDPCQHLPPSRKEIMADLSQMRLPEALWREVKPACHRVSKKEEARLIRRLLKSGMVTLLPEDTLPRDSQGNLLTGGFFCVKKNSTEDRLIFDRRPENATMSRLRCAKLPAGACFSRVLLDDHQFLRGSGDDLRNYYYTLALPSNWVKYNSVGRRVPDDIVAEWGGSKGVRYRAALTVLGMGDTNGCDVAQAVHEHILENSGLLQPEHKLTYGNPVPQNNLLEGAYLDDLLVVFKVDCPYKVPRDGSFIPPPAEPEDPDMQHVRCAELAYEASGLERALHKSFRAQTCFKAWGAEVDGIGGSVGASLEVRRQIWTVLVPVIQIGAATKHLLQRVLGYVCFAFQYRRELYALQHHIYKYVDSMEERKVYRLPSFVLDELRSILLHLPFAKWQMRRHFQSTVLATDATPTSGGATRARVGPELSRELWQRCEIRGEAVRLDRSGSAMELEAGKPPKEPSQFASLVAECLDWYSTASYVFKETSHINLQELRALRRELYKLASDKSNHNSVQLCFNDSRVVVGAVSKGRSSSFKLNGLLRTLIPFLVLSNIALGLLWVETSSNPADFPSRFLPLPIPRSPPGWLRAFGVFRSWKPGIEIFAGSARITTACIEAGLEMMQPIDILWGIDVFETWIDQLFETGELGWVWLAPPCCSFSALRNLDRNGPLRPRGKPEGDESIAEVKLCNALWRRALQLAWKAWRFGIPFFLEHPRNSRAWLLRETGQLFGAADVRGYEVHWCGYSDEERLGLPNKKPTRIVTSVRWFSEVVRVCPGDHEHGPALRGSRAKRASAYPWGFCRLFASALKKWHGAPSERRALEVVPQKSA